MSLRAVMPALSGRDRRPVPLRPAAMACPLTAGTSRVPLMAVDGPAASFAESCGAAVLESPLPAGLADREFGNRPGRRLRLDPRQTGANQRPMQAHLFGGCL